MPYKISPFDKSFDRSSFSCGEESLDNYLKKHVSQDIARGAAGCFVLHEVDCNVVLGYFTLAASSFQLTNLPKALAKKAPRYKVIPAALLGRLAVDKTIQGNGWGSVLIYAAMKKVVANSDTLAVHAMVVDPLNERAAKFYNDIGFKAMDGIKQMIIPMSEIRKLPRVKK